MEQGEALMGNQPELPGRLALNSTHRQARLATRIPELESQIEQMQAKLDAAMQELATIKASATSAASITEDKLLSFSHKELLEKAREDVDRQIVMISRYNESKDISMRLLTIIANSEGKRLEDIMADREIEDD